MRQDLILKKPIITEKTMLLAQKGKFTFLIDVKANKNQVKEAIESQFKVNIVDISTTKIKGKVKSFGKKRNKVSLSDIKKAVVTLKKDQKIDLFDIKENK